MNELSDWARSGWLRFPKDPDLEVWCAAALGPALDVSSDATLRSEWLRHGETWFSGVNALPNDADGVVAKSGPLKGCAIDFLQSEFEMPQWDKAQISIIYPGYPKQDVDESDAAHRFRKLRDAAHVDGLLPIGPARRRHLQEPHAFVLGVPLNQTSTDASPMVVWEGSHLVMRTAFRTALHGVSPDDWSAVDLTETYHVARKRCFETCNRVTVHAHPGEAYLIHRLALHGVAPWSNSATAPLSGRIIAYFRPELSDISDWLS